jgi:hypothetical protein
VRALGFVLEQRGAVWVVVWQAGGCRPATIAEVALWKRLQEAK